MERPIMHLCVENCAIMQKKLKPYDYAKCILKMILYTIIYMISYIMTARRGSAPRPVYNNKYNMPFLRVYSVYFGFLVLW